MHELINYISLRKGSITSRCWQKKLLKCKSTVNGITWYRVVYKLIESCNTYMVIFYKTTH